MAEVFWAIVNAWTLGVESPVTCKVVWGLAIRVSRLGCTETVTLAHD